MKSGLNSVAIRTSIEEHEGELFKRIAEIEEQERRGELVKGLNKTDYALIVIMFVAAWVATCGLVRGHVFLMEVYYG